MNLRNQQRDYWICQLSGWSLLAVLGWLSASSSGSTDASLRFGVAKTLCVLTGLGLSHVWHAYLRRTGWLARSGRIPIGRIAALLLAPSLSASAVLVLIDRLVLAGGLFRDNPQIVLTLVLVGVLWYLVFAVWTLCYAVALERRRSARVELDKLELEVSVKEAELRALQFQINPHFFFNSLNSVRALIYEDADAAAQAVSKLAGMMRYSLNSGRQPTVTVAEEIEAVRAYLDMEKLRFEERLQLQIDVAPEAATLRLPPMVIQTLAENAVRHGVEHAVGPCAVRLAAAVREGRLHVTVANQGRLATASDSTRLGLANTARRLALQFDHDARCTLDAGDGWVYARLDLPARTQ